MKVAAETSPVDLESLVAKAADRFTEEVQQGASPSVEEYARRHPEIAHIIRQVFPTLAMLDRYSATGLSGDATVSLSGNAENDEHLVGVIGDFRILRELGRGGMGVVYEAEQISLGRHIALKVLPFAAMLDKQQLARFKNEARAAATLDHPHIVAIHSVGCERDMHYYAMQLIEGQSLAEIIAQLKLGRAQSDEKIAPPAVLIKQTTAGDTVNAAEPTLRTRGGAAVSNLPVFGSREYFRTIAQLGLQAAEALDHAHKNGILHRDVKPGNLLLDDVGKLWVTDFGLARIETETAMTMTGDLLGTLRYMSPEQVLAKREVVDHRSDVYSLGLTLYELATLHPAFTGEDRQELLRQIAYADPRKPRQINARIPRDLETIVLKAIEKNPSDRYATAQALADDLRRFVDDRPIRAKQQNLFATVRKWSRRHRGLLVATAATLVVSGLVLAGSIGWVARDRAARQTVAEATASLALDETTRLMAQSKWPESLAAVRRAEDVLASGGHGGTWSSRAQDLRKDVEMVLRLEEIRHKPTRSTDEITYAPNGEAKHRRLEDGPEYAQAFRDYGICIESLDPSEAAARVRDRSIRLELAIALDTWARWRRSGDDPGWKRLVEIARAADPDPWRNRLRDALADNDRKSALISLAASADSEDLHPRTAVMLAGLLDDAGAAGNTIGPLRAVQQRHPDDFFINLALARCLHLAEPADLEGAVRFYTAAIALRPGDGEAHNNLGHVLADKGLKDEARAHFQEAVRLEPDNALAHFNLGLVFKDEGLLEKASDSMRTAVRLAPRDPFAHACLADVLLKQGALDEAIASYREAIRLKPDLIEVHNNLGVALIEKGLWDDAIASFQEEFRLNPDHCIACDNLELAFASRGRRYEAIAYFKEMVRLQPDSARAHRCLGVFLIDDGQLDAAIASCQQAVHLKPDFAEAHLTLGAAYFHKDMMDEAIASFLEAIRLEPDFSDAHHNLMHALERAGRLDEAVTDFKLLQTELGPSHPDTLGIADALSRVLADHRKFDEARQLCEEALAASRRDWGSEHSNTVKAMKSLVRAFIFSEEVLSDADAGHAQRLCEETLDLARRVMGPEHVDTLGTAYDLGLLLRIRGRNEEALQLLNASFAENLRVFGPDHFMNIHFQQEIAKTLYSRGALLVEKGQWDEGVASFKESIRTYRQQDDEGLASASYQEALELLQKNHAAVEVVDRFRTEAAKLLGKDPQNVDDEKTGNGA